MVRAMTSTNRTHDAIQVAARLLGLTTTATQPEIKRAFRLFAELTHPDRNPGNPNAAEDFRRVRFAADILTTANMGLPMDAYKIDVLLAVPTPAPDPKIVAAYAPPTFRAATFTVLA